MEREHSSVKVDSSPKRTKDRKGVFKELEKKYPLPSLKALPRSLPSSFAVRIEFSEEVPILKASESVQLRIEELLQKGKDVGLAEKEEEELDQYEEIDDYLSFLNRVVRNIFYEQQKES